MEFPEQTGQTYTDTGLSRLTQYCYRVKARNVFNNLENEWSEVLCATTPCDDSIPPYFPDGIYWEVGPCECNNEYPQNNTRWHVVMRAAEAEDDSSAPLQYRFLCTESRYSSGWQTSRCWDILVGIPNQGLQFKVQVRDECGNQSESDLVLILRCYSDGHCPPDVCDY